MDRRKFLQIGLLSVFGAGCSTLSETSTADIKIANRTDQTLQLDVEVSTRDTLLSNPETVYDKQIEIEPTNAVFRVREDVVPQGSYIVDIRVSGFQNREPVEHPTYIWENSCDEQVLIIGIDPSGEVDLLQNNCS